MRSVLLLAGLLLVSAGPVHAQDRDTKVRNDRETFKDSLDWIYNNLEEGIQASKESGKPLFVVFRCIPCEACQEFDDDVARRDPIIRDLLDQYVCVRIVQANNIDLTTFQHDFDQSFAAYLMNPDKTIYARFGTRSDRPEFQDISLEGLRKAMEAGLRIHKNYAQLKSALAGKQVTQTRYKTPRDYPSLKERFGTSLDYEGEVARSCMHCHQIRDAERMTYHEAGKPIPDKVLFPYPDPSRIGLTMDPKEKATVREVAPDSPAARAGIRPGDEIATLEGQPLLSIADLQWVLQNAPGQGQLQAGIRRDDSVRDVTINLPEGWRRGNISWRATTWELRRLGFGGMKLDEMTDEQRREAGLSEDGMALRIGHVGQYGEHAIAKNAGFQRGDIIVSFDGLTRRMTESELLAHALQQKRPGDPIAVTLLRDGERKNLTFHLP